MDQFIACFERQKASRTGNAGLHDLHELLFIALCTVLSGEQAATELARFAAAREPFLRGFLKLEHFHGDWNPSHAESGGSESPLAYES